MKLKGRIRYRDREWGVYTASQRELIAMAGPCRKDEEVCGFCDMDNARLFVWSRGTVRQRRFWLFHELLEMANHGGRIGLRHAQIEKLEAELGALIHAPL